ncbi:MAG: hypothetical protein AB7O69_16325 [Burkholderiales bacterium]
MSKASQQIASKAWNFAHVLAHKIIEDLENAFDQLRGVAAELKA